MPRLNLHHVGFEIDLARRELAGRKRFDTLRAYAALAQFELAESSDDHGHPVFVIVRGALCERLGSLDHVEQWLARAGALEAAPA